MKRYVALLRGINVGGKNLVSMADLRGALEDAGYADVGTYIQSGNVLFSTDLPRAQLEPAIERDLAERLGHELTVVVRSHTQLRNVVAKAPGGFGADPTTFHYDVIFLKAPLTPTTTMGVIDLRDGVDRAWPGTGVVYFSRLSAERTKSRLSRIVGTPEYRSMTIRNWNTTTTLLALLDAD